MVKKTFVGTYDDEKTAARSYNSKAIELYGEYANLNYITDNEKDAEEVAQSDA